MFNDLIFVDVNSSGPRTCTFYFLTEHDVSKRRFPTKNTPFCISARRPKCACAMVYQSPIIVIISSLRCCLN